MTTKRKAKPKLAEVITLYESNASDIASMLRSAADVVESEAEDGFVGPKATRAVVAVQITNGGGLKVYGWGKTDSLDSIGILNLGLAYLTNEMVARSLEDDEE